MSESRSNPLLLVVVAAFGLGALLLSNAMFAVALSWAVPGWRGMKIERHENVGMHAIVRSHDGMTHDRRMECSLCFVVGVCMVAGGWMIHKRRFSLRALMIAVLLAGMTGSYPHVLFVHQKSERWLTLGHEFATYDALRRWSVDAEIARKMERSGVLESLPPEWRERFDRVAFETVVDVEGGGADLRIRIPEEVARDEADSVTAYCFQYFQTLFIEGLPEEHADLSPFNFPWFSSTWTNTGAKEWERQRKVKAAESIKGDGKTSKAGREAGDFENNSQDSAGGEKK